MIVKTITDDYYFWNWLKKSDSYKNNFSLEGAKAVQGVMYEYSEETSEAGFLEFDPIAWCCEFSEYKSALECAQEYGYEEVVDLEPHGSVDLLEVAKLEEKQAREWLEDRTQVIELENGGVVIQNF